MYRIRDLQIPGRYFANGVKFPNREAVIDQLADYHSVDFDDGKEFRSIAAWLRQFKTIKAQLAAILEYGEWELERC